MHIRNALLFTAFFGAALLTASPAAADRVTVSYSQNFAQELTETYGEREGVYLSEEIVSDVNAALQRAGIEFDRIEITILDAKPNRATRAQQRGRPGLDLSRSMGVGGMSLVGTAYDESGAVIGEYAYRRFETDIGNVVGFGTWTDAHRVSDRFARRFAKTLKR